MDQRDYVRCYRNGDGESAGRSGADEAWPDGDGGALTPTDPEWTYTENVALPLRRKLNG